MLSEFKWYRRWRGGYWLGGSGWSWRKVDKKEFDRYVIRYKYPPKNTENYEEPTWLNPNV